MFEYLGEDNFNADEITVKVGGYYYNKTQNQLQTLNFGNTIVKKGEADLVETDGATIDFTKIFGAHGITLTEFKTLLNDGDYIISNPLISNPYGYKTESLEELVNSEDCFDIEENNGGSVVKYSDKSSDYIMLTFSANKINGETPSFKITFLDYELEVVS